MPSTIAMARPAPVSTETANIVAVATAVKTGIQRCFRMNEVMTLRKAVYRLQEPLTLHLSLLTQCSAAIAAEISTITATALFVVYIKFRVELLALVPKSVVRTGHDLKQKTCLAGSIFRC